MSSIKSNGLPVLSQFDGDINLLAKWLAISSATCKFNEDELQYLFDRARDLVRSAFQMRSLDSSEVNSNLGSILPFCDKSRLIELQNLAFRTFFSETERGSLASGDGNDREDEVAHNWPARSFIAVSEALIAALPSGPSEVDKTHSASVDELLMETEEFVNRYDMLVASLDFKSIVRINSIVSSLLKHCNDHLALAADNTKLRTTESIFVAKLIESENTDRFALNVSSSCALIEKLEHCRIFPDVFWRKMQRAIVSSDSSTCKRAAFTLQRIQGSADAKSTQDKTAPRSRLCPFAASLQTTRFSAASFWNDFWIVYEVLNEPQFHLVEPVLRRFQLCIERYYEALLENPQLDAEPSWLVTLFEHGHRHINASIQRWAATNMLRMPLHVFAIFDIEYLCNSFLEATIRMINTALFYAPVLRIDSECDKPRLLVESAQTAVDCTNSYLTVPISANLDTFFDNLLRRVAQLETAAQRTDLMLTLLRSLLRADLNEAALLFSLRALCNASQRRHVDSLTLRCLDASDVRQLVVECGQVLKQSDVPIRCALAHYIAHTAFEHVQFTSLTLSDFCMLLAFLHDAQRGVLWQSTSTSSKNKRLFGRRNEETMKLCRNAVFQNLDEAVQRTVNDWLREARSRLFCEAAFRDAQFAEDAQFVDGCAVLLSCFYDSADPKNTTRQQFAFDRDTLLPTLIDNLFFNAERAYMNPNAHLNAAELCISLFRLDLYPGEQTSGCDYEFAKAIESVFVDNAAVFTRTCLIRIRAAVSKSLEVDRDSHLFSLLCECSIRRRNATILAHTLDYLEQLYRESACSTSLLKIIGLYLREFEKFTTKCVLPDAIRQRTLSLLQSIVANVLTNADNNSICTGTFTSVDFFACLSHVLKDEPVPNNDLYRSRCTALLEACCTTVECQTEITALCVGVRCLQQLVTFCWAVEGDRDALLRTVRSVYTRLKREAYSSTREYREVLQNFIESLFTRHQSNPLLMQVAAEICSDYDEMGCVYPGMMHDPVHVLLQAAVQRPSEITSLFSDHFVDFLADCCTFGPLRSRGLHDTCALADYLDSLPDLPTVTSTETGLMHNDSLVRVDVALFLARLQVTSSADTQLAVSVFDRLLFAREPTLGRSKSAATSNSQRTSYFNTHYHRQRCRLFTTLLVLHEHVARGESERLTRVLKRCFDMLPDERFSNVRNLIEWLIVLLFCKTSSAPHRTLVAERIRDGLALAQERPSMTCSILSLLIQFCKVLDRESLSMLLDCALPAVLEHILVSQNYTIRLHAAYLLKRCAQTFTCDPTSGLSGEHSSSTHTEQFIHKYLVLFDVFEKDHVTRSEAYKKHIGKIESSFWAAQFDPLADFSLETLYFDLLRLSDMIQAELVHPSTFEKRFAAVFRNSGELSCPIENSRAVLRNTSRVYQWRFKEDEINEEAFANEIDLLGNTQKKVIPNPDGELGCCVTRKTSLIVVASLIDKPPNLGGLCRTCEIFAARELVIHSRNVLQDAEFRALSVSAEQWLTLTEVRVRDLHTYLDRMRREHGYTVIAIEQTANSRQLESFRFPEKSLLLLGHEKTGVPADLLNLVDACVEIPQAGIIRSLNVHVTGAIVVWEYFKQHFSVEQQ